MSGTLSLGRIAGIRVRASYSWLVVLALLVATLAAGWFPQAARASAGTYLALGIVGALLFVASVLVHELAHVAVARYRGLAVSRITLFPFGGVSDLDREPRAPGEEFQLAIAGPLANFLLAGIASLLQERFFPVRYPTGELGPSALPAALFGFLSTANALLGLLNLVPGYPLDGGRMLRALLWRAPGEAGEASESARRAAAATPSVRVVGGRGRSFAAATRLAALAGQAAAYLLILWGIWRFFGGEPTPGLWLVVAGFTLLDAARAASGPAAMAAALEGVTAGEVMRPAGATAPSTATLQQLADDQVLSRGMRAVPVVQGERFVGLITLADMSRTPRDQWARTPLSRAMTPLERLCTVAPDGAAGAALAEMARRDVGQVPVLRGGRLVGMLGRGDVLDYLGPREAPTPAEAERAAEATEATKPGNAGSGRRI